MFTLTNLGVFIFLAAVGAVIVWFIWYDEGKFNKTVRLSIAICVAILVVMIAVTGWYNTHTAAGQRALKDNTSNLNKGIEREITITAEDGREIFHYKGKVDIESNHIDNYIKFESEEGKRYIIYYGIQDTIQIIEK